MCNFLIADNKKGPLLLFLFFPFLFQHTKEEE